MKKKTWISVGILAAGALAIGSWLAGTAALDHPSEALSLPAVTSSDSGGDGGDGSDERRTTRARTLSQKAVLLLRSVILLPISMGLKALGFLLRRLCDAALLPLLRFLGGWAFSFLVLLGLFCLLFKLLFPERSLREFLCWKNIRWILLGSFLLPGADAALRDWCEPYHYLRAAALTLLLCGVVLFLWIKCFGSPLGAGGRLRALLRRPGGWVLPALLLVAAVAYGWADLNVSHETLEQNLLDAVWFYAVSAGTVGAIAVHRLQKRRKIREASLHGGAAA